MYVTDLRGLRIFSLVSALRMGTVEDALLDPSCRYVAALKVREYGPGGKQLVPRESVVRVGRNAVIVAGSDDKPQAADLEHADRFISLQTFLGLEVVSDHGNLIGHIRDAQIDPETLAVDRYEVARPALDRLLHHSGPARLTVGDTLSASKDVMIVPESLLTGIATDEAQPTHADTADMAHLISPDVMGGPDGVGATMG